MHGRKDIDISPPGFWIYLKSTYPDFNNEWLCSDISCIHSFILAIFVAPLKVLYYSEALPTTARILYRSFSPKRTGNCIRIGLAQGPYVAAGAGVEPTTLRLKVIDSTNAPPRSHYSKDTQKVKKILKHETFSSFVLSSAPPLNSA